MRKLLFIPALALAASTIAGAALASSDDKEAANPQPNWMTIEQVTKKLTDAGYKVRQVKAEDDGYEVSAIDMNGRRLEALVDPVTGDVLESESGEDND